LEKNNLRKINTISSLNKEFDFDIVKSIFKSNWYIIPIVILIGLSTGYTYLRYTKPVYQSSAIIQRTSKDEGKRILAIDNFEQESKLSEDVELLRSTFLLEKALRNLNLKISYYSEGKILTEEKYLHSSYHVTFLELKDSSLVGKRIYVRNNNQQLELVINKSKNEIVYNISKDGIIDNDQFNLIFKINNDKWFWDAVDANKLYFIFNDYKGMTNLLHRDLSVYVVNGEAKTVHVGFKSNNSTLASNIVGSVIETFFNYDLEKKSKSSENILSFIDEQLDTVYHQLKLSEDNIQEFRDGNNAKDPTSFKESIIAQIDMLQTQSLNAELEFSLINDLDFGINSKNRIDVYNLIPAITGSRFQGLLEGQINKLHELLVGLEDASYGMTTVNDAVKKLNTNIDIQIEVINRTLISVKHQVKGRRDNILNKISKLESQLYGVPAKEVIMSRLKRKFNLNEKYYSLLIEKRTQYEISKAGYTMNNLVLQEPSIPILISPQKKMIYVAMFVVSILISLLLLVLKYITFNVIHNETELKKLVPENIGFLGVVPKVNTGNMNSILMVHLKPKSMLAETYRNIRSNLHFIMDSKKSNVIAISSSISGEGKTFVALNLAGILAMSNKKVIVLDLDLRKPKVHLGFNASNLDGMSSVLADKNKWSDCVQQTELDGLDFISAGVIPPNPSELILNGILDDIVLEMKTKYDYVIIDNPPVGIVSDGVKVLNDADCSIYIFRANYSKRIYANKVRELLAKDKVEKLFMILNDVDMNKNSYGYGYGYGGYYEEDIKEKKRFSFRKK